MNKIPYDIIINYIAPFTYSVQNKEIRKDITTYVFILNSLKKLYILNNISNSDLDSILYFNLINYCMSNKLDYCKEFWRPNPLFRLLQILLIVLFFSDAVDIY